MWLRSLPQPLRVTMPSSSVSFQSERQHILLSAKRPATKDLHGTGNSLRGRKGFMVAWGRQRVTAMVLEFLWGRSTHHQAAQVCKYERPCTICSKPRILRCVNCFSVRWLKRKRLRGNKQEQLHLVQTTGAVLGCCEAKQSQMKAR